MTVRGVELIKVLALSCTIYDFCERNFEGLWDLRELLLLLSSGVPASEGDHLYWSLSEDGSTQLREFFKLLSSTV